jgi:hypothetical protein
MAKPGCEGRPGEERQGRAQRSDSGMRVAGARTAAGALGVADDVRHARLEAHEGRQVRRLGGIILRELVHCEAAGETRARAASGTASASLQAGGLRQLRGRRAAAAVHGAATPKPLGLAAARSTYPCPGGAASASWAGSPASRSEGARTSARTNARRERRRGGEAARISAQIKQAHAQNAAGHQRAAAQPPHTRTR